MTPTRKMRGTWIEADQGHNVNGEWEVKTRRLFVTVSGGDVYISRSDHISSPTLIEMPMSDLLRALADGEDYA